MAVALRMDLSRPVPLRRTPEFLFGDLRRRTRRAAACGGVALALVVGGVWMAQGDAWFQRDTAGTVAPTVVLATGAVSPPAMEEFPLILEPPPRAARSSGEAGTPPALLQPLAEPLASTPRETQPPAFPPLEPAETPPAPSSPASPGMVDQTLSPPASTASTPPPAEHEGPAPLVQSPAPALPASLPSPPQGEASTEPAGYLLQLGTYRLERSARDDQEHYRSLGIATVILRRGAYFVLRLPPFANQAEAEREEARLRRQGISPLFIPPTGSQE
jgi:hypothetical protein